MKKLYLITFAIQFFIQLNILLSCTAAENLNTEAEMNNSSEKYIAYIINNNLHTGIVIPVNEEMSKKITALKYFHRFSYIDIGWGEEKFYQDPKDNFCMGARAVLLPNTSVIRIEGYNSFTDDIIGWSDYAVMMSLTKDQYFKLISFIEKSFTRNEGNELIITKQKHSGSIIFFKSVYKYHLFNTCNTWIAEVLKASGLDVSPFFVITAGQLYNEIKDKGKILKALK
jgi:uncharacterized protein (TIGR02117 family)